jgi:Uma2 family endonuclease
MEDLHLLEAQLRPLKVSEYLALAKLGVFENEKVELLRGRVVRMAPQGEEHSWVMGMMNNALVRGFGAWATVRPALPFRADDHSMPEPDFALTPPMSAPGPHPERALLLIEVAMSSLRLDRGIKAETYAASGSPEYWVIDVAAARLEVFRAPKGDQWTERFTLGPADTVRPVAFPEVDFPLRDILGPLEPH